jgi:opacity protein-like surface antigen
MNKTIFAFVLTMIISYGAHAALMVEPHLGYEMSTMELISNLAPTADFGGKVTGTSLGARIGYKFPMMIWVAGDVDYTTGKLKFEDSTQTDGDVTRTTMFLDVGVDLPILFRAWAGYGFSDTAKLTQSGSADTTFKNGTALKLGVGFKVIPLLSINVEYIQRTLNDFESGTPATTQSASSIFSKSAKDTGMIVSVSAPFNF